MKITKEFQRQFRSLSPGCDAVLLLLIALTCVIFFGQIRYIPVPTIDGALRASMGRHMYETGVLWPPFYQNQPLIDHPPLFLWMVALAYKLFGVNDLAFHLVQRVSAFGVVCLVAVTSRRLFARSTFQSLVAIVVLLTTRDFVLSSVRGYIEPLLEFFIYLSIYVLIPILFESVKDKSIVRMLLSGFCIFLALFSKGPVALWPMLFVAIILGRRLGWRGIVWYSLPSVLCGLITVACLAHFGKLSTLGQYLNEQIFASALEGRNHEQTLEPFYFLTILLKSYWPWIVFLVLFAVRAVKQRVSLVAAKEFGPEYFFFILALGFIGAFSAMHWKFWYYIAPAYPALAIVVSYELVRRLNNWQWLRNLELKYQRQVVRAAVVGAIALLLITVATNTPYWPNSIKFYRDRVPELTILKNELFALKSDTIYFWHPTRDHNQLDTSLYWMFRIKLKKTDNCRALSNELTNQAALTITVWTDSSCASELKAAARTVHAIKELKESVLLSLQK